MKKKVEIFEKVFITRDECSDNIFVWRKPDKGVWKPDPLKGCEIVNFQRTDRSIDNVDAYLESDFKKKFNITIKEKVIKNTKLSKKLLDNDDYKLFSDNYRRKK